MKEFVYDPRLELVICVLLVYYSCVLLGLLLCTTVRGKDIFQQQNGMYINSSIEMLFVSLCLLGFVRGGWWVRTVEGRADPGTVGDTTLLPHTRPLSQPSPRK